MFQHDDDLMSCSVMSLSVIAPTFSSFVRVYADSYLQIKKGEAGAASC